MAKNLELTRKHITFALAFNCKACLTDNGEMVEWSITTVLKTVVLRGTGGSNPSLSAKPTGQTRTVSGQKPTNQRFVGFLLPISLVPKTRKGLKKT